MCFAARAARLSWLSMTRSRSGCKMRTRLRRVPPLTYDRDFVRVFFSVSESLDYELCMYALLSILFLRRRSV